MAGSNSADVLNSLSKGMNITSSALGTIGSMWGAYNSGPKAKSIKPYLKQLGAASIDYTANDPEGLMAQWNMQQSMMPGAISAKDLYNPSTSQLFASYMGSGMSGYTAGKALGDSITDGLDMGTTYINGGSGYNTANQKGWGAAGNFLQQKQEGRDTKLATSFIDDTLTYGVPMNTKINFGKPQGVKLLEPQVDLTKTIMPQKIGNSVEQGIVNTIKTPMGNTQSDNIPYDWGDMARTGIPFIQDAYGGNLFDLGGTLALSNAGMFSTGLGLGVAGLDTLFNYWGQEKQKRLAKDYAAIGDAANAFVNDRNSHGFGNAVIDTKGNQFNMQAIQMAGLGGYQPSMFAGGGFLTTNGADFPLNGGFNYIGNGGTHEQNPYDGVPQGIAPDGKQNLVEENEVVWNNYVFSHRLTIPKDFAKKYKLKEGITFSEAAEKLAREMKERPNDPISNRGVEAQLGELRDVQEGVRQKMEANKIKKAVNKMSPEELMALQQMLMQGQQQEAQPMQEQQQMQGIQGMQEMLEGVSPEQIISAFGGDIFGNGGYLGQHRFDDGGYRILRIGSKNYRVTQQFYDDYKAGKYKITVEENGTIKATKAPDGYQYTKEGPMVKVGSDSGSGTRQTSKGTEEALTGEYENKGNFLDENGQLNAPRMDTSKTVEQVRAREAEDLYTKTNAYIRQQLANYAAGVDQDLSKVDPKLIAKLREVDQQFTRGKYDDPSRLFDKDGNLRRDALTVLFGVDGTGGLRTDGKEGPNHWSADWLDTPPSETPYDWQWEEWKPTEVKREPTPEYIPPVYETVSMLGPLAGNFVGLGLLDKVNYDTAVKPLIPSYRPIGDYLRYNPVDTQRYINAHNQKGLAQLNAIMNASGANKNMAMAQAALANSQSQAGYNDILNAAEAMNFERQSKVGEFNRGTNQFNASAFNDSQKYLPQINELMSQQAQQNANRRMQSDAAYDAAVGENLTALFDNIGEIGTRNFWMNNINWNPANRFAMTPFGTMHYKSGQVPEVEDEVVIKPDTTDEGTKDATVAAFGRYLTKRKGYRRK